MLNVGLYLFFFKMQYAVLIYSVAWQPLYPYVYMCYSSCALPTPPSMTSLALHMQWKG